MGTLAALAYFISDKEWTGTAVSALGLIVESTGTKFVTDRRKEAKDEEEAAWTDLNTRCPAEAPAAKAAVEQTKILGLR